MRKLILTLTVLLGTSGFAGAQDSSASNGPLSKLYECTAISDDTSRLACFDTNVAVIQVKEEKKEIVAIDAESAKSIKREAFGFSLPSLPKLGLPSLSGNSDGPEVLTFPIKSVQKRGGNYIFIMENGQMWRQVSGRFNYIPKGDLEATIKSGAIGSYRISISNGKERVRGMGVRRVE